MLLLTEPDMFLHLLWFHKEDKKIIDYELLIRVQLDLILYAMNKDKQK